MSSIVASTSKMCIAACAAGRSSCLRTNATRRGSSASFSAIGGGTGLVCSQPRRQRNCGSSDSMSASAVVPVRGSPLMSIGPLMATSSTSGCAAYHASTCEAVDQPASQVADHRRVGVGVEVAVAFEAVEKYLQALAEVAGTEVVVAVFGDGLVHQPVGRWDSATAHRSITRSG